MGLQMAVKLSSDTYEPERQFELLLPVENKILAMGVLGIWASPKHIW